MDNLRKKILITGASGAIAGIVRQLYSNHCVELWSTKNIELSKNEILKKSVDLADESWWKTPHFEGHYDVIFHFAEPVKRKLPLETVDKIIESHIAFLMESTKYSPKVVYPLTAYRYDQHLSFKNRQYRDIKERVALSLQENHRISLPIIHPLINYGNGLNNIKNIFNKIPFINPLSEFKAELHVLDLLHLNNYLLNIENQKNGIVNIYSEVLKIHDIFNISSKKNIKIISLIVLNFVKLLPNGNVKNILINGRKIDD